jgi:hypothetical protein
MIITSINEFIILNTLITYLRAIHSVVHYTTRMSSFNDQGLSKRCSAEKELVFVITFGQKVL